MKSLLGIDRYLKADAVQIAYRRGDEITTYSKGTPSECEKLVALQVVDYVRENIAEEDRETYVRNLAETILEIMDEADGYGIEVESL